MGTIGKRAIKEPLWFYIKFKGGGHQFLAGETNLRSQRQIPAGHHFFFYGLSLLPDSNTSYDALKTLYDHGKIRFHFEPNIKYAEWPCRILMHNPETLPRGKELYTILEEKEPRRSVCISGKPIELASELAFSFEIECNELEGLDGVGEEVGLMLVLFGIQLRGICS